MKKQAVNVKVGTAWNPWPYAIAAWLVLFATGMAVWIVVAVRNDMDLVREDYYEHEVLFQRQIDRVTRTARAGHVEVDYDAGKQAITIQLPSAHVPGAAKGAIQFYRPSDAKLDYEVALALNGEGAQRIDARNLRSGLWKVRLHWTVNGEEFYFDRPLIIAPDKS